MKHVRTGLAALLISGLIHAATAPAVAQSPSKPYQPTVGQPGKDVVWVPSPEEMVERALDLAAVTPQDFVIDLGSGDGRNVIAAAKRGARALGVEYNSDLVELSKEYAAKAGVADKASFVQGDMFEADISKATVMALFLLPDNLKRLRDKFLELRPGTRIVANTFGIEGWTPDESKTFEDGCTSWCTIMLWIVPAKVAGTWKTGSSVLSLQQEYQMISGTFNSAPIDKGRVKGDQISFTANGVEYNGRVNGNTIQGTATAVSGAQKWTATRAGA
jgi:SAM-dependent methyltransferase